MMNRKYLVVLGLVLAGSAMAAEGISESSTYPGARSEDRNNTRPNIGIFVGAAAPSDNMDSAVNYGVDIGLTPAMPISLGIQASRFEVKNDAALGNMKFSRIPLLGKVAYNVGGEVPVLRSMFLGAKAGVVFDKYEVNTAIGNASSDRTDFAIAPMAGFDIPIQKAWTAGVEGSYLFVQNNNDINNLDVHGAVKYWF